MGLVDDLKSEVAKIFGSQWSIRDGQVVPDTPDLKLENDGVKLAATVLYADIDGSTSMVDSKVATFAAEAYKTYLLCASRIIRSEPEGEAANRIPHQPQRDGRDHSDGPTPRSDQPGKSDDGEFQSAVAGVPFITAAALTDPAACTFCQRPFGNRGIFHFFAEQNR
jgi:hypothetical protein